MSNIERIHSSAYQPRSIAYNQAIEALLPCLKLFWVGKEEMSATGKGTRAVRISRRTR